MVVSRIEDEKQFLLDNPKREMSKLEIYGAMYFLHELAREEEILYTISLIDHISYYCNKALQLHDGLLVGNGLVVDSVFMLGNNKEDLFGYAFYENYEEDLFLIRIS